VCSDHFSGPGKSVGLVTARRYASAVLVVVVCSSVSHTPVLCQND